MADRRFSLLLTLGFLIAAYGTDKHGAFGDVEQTTKGKKDLLSIILTPNPASTGANTSETNNGTSDLLDGIIGSIFGDEPGHQQEISSKGNGLHTDTTGGIANKKKELTDVTSNGKRVHPNSSSNGNQNLHSHPTGDFNAGSTSGKPKPPDAVKGEVNKDRAPGDSNSAHSNSVNGKVKGNSSYGVVSESDVHFPGGGGPIEPEVFEGVINVNGDATDEISKRNGTVLDEVSGQKGGKYTKKTTDTPGKIEVEPYYIIDAPIRENDDGHGCKNGQRWSFGHCRDILD